MVANEAGPVPSVSTEPAASTSELPSALRVTVSSTVNEPATLRPRRLASMVASTTTPNGRGRRYGRTS